MLPSLTLFASAYLSISSNQEHQGVLKGATCPGQGDLAGHTSTWPSAALYGMHLFGQDLSEDEGNHLRFLFEQILFSISVRIPSLLACLNYSPMMSKESPSPVYMATLATSLRIYFNWRCRRQDKIINGDSLFITLIIILVSQNVQSGQVGQGDQDGQVGQRNEVFEISW